MSILGAYIVPHPPITISKIGKGREDKVSNTIKSYDIIAKNIADSKPDTILIITPHSTIYADYFHISPGNTAEGNFTKFGAPDINFHVTYDKELAEDISAECVTNHIQAGGLGNAVEELDHGTMVPLHFINKYYTNYKIVRVSISDYSAYNHYLYGKHIAKICNSSKKNIIVIASGDLSHYLTEEGPYGYRHEGPIFDSSITDIMKSTNFIDLFTYMPNFLDRAGACILRPFSIMAGMLDGVNVTSNFMSYDGSLGVGYAICEFIPTTDYNEPISSRQFDIVLCTKIKKDFSARNLHENAYVKLARITIEHLVLKNRFLTMNDIIGFIDEDMLTKTAGTFVSIKRDGDIRGCIGTTIPTTGCIAHEIINNAINAGYNDPRFVPISVDELPYLTYSVDVLNPPEPISSIEELDVSKYGLIVTCDKKRGLLLPNLDSVKTPKIQLDIALKKAGISHDEEYTMERFEVIRYL